MKKGTTNLELKKLIIELKKTKKPAFIKVAEMLERPRRKRVEVNLWKINKNSKEDDLILVPGKVLANGELEHKVTIAALNASEKAIKKINEKGKFISLKEATKEKAKIKIMG